MISSGIAFFLVAVNEFLLDRYWQLSKPESVDVLARILLEYLFGDDLSAP